MLFVRDGLVDDLIDKRVESPTITLRLWSVTHRDTVPSYSLTSIIVDDQDSTVHVL